jgi:hypothetical protein
MKNYSIFVLLLITACSSTGVVPINGDTYMIAKRSAQVGFGPPDGVKAEVYKEANSYCSNMQKSVETVDLVVTNSGFAKPGNVSLEFRCK